MRKLFSVIITFGALLLSITSCDQESDTPLSPSGDEIQLSVAIQQTTRSTTDAQYKTNFSISDSIGVFVYKRTADGSNGELVAANQKYTFDGSQWKAEGEALISKEGTSLNFYAYYPYDVARTDYRALPASVRMNQSQEVDFYASDFLIAKNTNSAMNERSIRLTFTHAFSLVEVHVTGPKAIDPSMTLRLKGILPESSLDLVNATTAPASGVAGEITLFPYRKEPQAMIYRAIVPGQTLVANQEILTISSTEGDFSFKHMADLTLNNRKVQPIFINLGSGPVPTITFNPSGFTVSGWEPNNPIDTTPDFEGGTLNLSDLVTVSLLNISSIADIGTKLPTIDLCPSTRWYAKTKANDSDATPMKYSFESDPTNGNMVTFNMARLKDNLYGVGFFRKEPYVNGQYKLTVKVRCANSISASELCVRVIGSVADGKGFVVSGSTAATLKIPIPAASANKFVSYNATFDFSKVDGGAAAPSTAYRTLDVRISGTANVQFSINDLQLVRVEP